MRQSQSTSSASTDFTSRPESGWMMRHVSAEGETQLRLIPYIMEDGTEQPQLIDPALAGTSPKAVLSETFTEYETLHFAGQNKYSFITEPNTPIVGPTPAMLMWATLRNYRKQHRKECPDLWYNWFERNIDGRKTEAFSKPRPCLYARCIIFRLGGKDVTDKFEHPIALFPCVIKLSQSSSADEMIKGLTQPLDPNKPLSIENSVFGDVTSCSNGKLLRITPENRMNPVLKRNQLYYSVSVCKEIPSYPISIEMVKNVNKPWTSILNVNSIEWIIERLAETFSSDAVYFALKDSPYGRYIPSHIEKEGRRSAPVTHPNVVSMNIPGTYDEPDLRYPEPVQAHPLPPAMPKPMVPPHQVLPKPTMAPITPVAPVSTQVSAPRPLTDKNVKPTSAMVPPPPPPSMPNPGPINPQVSNTPITEEEMRKRLADAQEQLKKLFSESQN